LLPCSSPQDNKELRDRIRRIHAAHGEDWNGAGFTKVKEEFDKIETEDKREEFLVGSVINITKSIAM